MNSRLGINFYLNLGLKSDLNWRFSLVRNLAIFIILVTISACATQQGRYKQKHDSTPTRLPAQSELHDAIPRVENPSRGGNKHYTVRGKDYKVLKHAKNFRQTGTASWYGKKFHGHLTSNGEIYDMYSMSAAHKNLPLPTYAKITNLSNQKTVIVRVNDRGPFHQDRIIDLSYSAAYKLDMLKTGTAKVHVEAITADNIDDILQQSATKNSKQLTKYANTSKENTPDNTHSKIDLNTTEIGLAQAEKAASLAMFEKEVINKSIVEAPTGLAKREPTTKNQMSAPYFVQVLATKNIDKARQISSKLAAQVSLEVNYPYSNGIFRIFIGPISSEVSQQGLLSQLDSLGYPNAYIKRNIR